MTEANTTEATNGANGSTGAPANSTNDASESTLPQSEVNRIVRRESEAALARGQETAINDFVREFDFDSRDEMSEFIHEMRQVSQAVETDNDRRNQRITRLERQNGTLEQERDQWRDRFFDSQRANALGNELLSIGLNPARAEVAIASQRANFGELEVDPETGKVEGAKELARNVKKQSPEWFPEAPGAPDASQRRVDNTPVAPGVGRLTRFFGGA